MLSSPTNGLRAIPPFLRWKLLGGNWLMVESNDTTNNETEEMEQDFESLFESSMQELHVGDVVRGTIVQVNDDNVVVDVGYK